jgi:hypothetical protein
LESYRQEDPRFVVYLVHGTWSADARWISHHSQFSERLAARLGGLLLLDRVRWSGKNSLQAREAATSKLRAEVNQRVAQFPGSAHVIIAHSHGGNIALRAISEGGLHRRVGLVCLSTPFLNVRRRNIPAIAQKLLELGVLAILAALLALPLERWSTAHHLSLWLKTNPWVAWADLKADDVMWAPVIAPLLLLVFLLKRARKKAEALWESLHYQVPAEAMLKILRTRGDEASAALSAYHLVSWLLTAAIGNVGAVVEAVREAKLVKKLPRRPWISSPEWKTAGLFKKAGIVVANCLMLAMVLLGLALLSPTLRETIFTLVAGYFAMLYLVPYLAAFVVGAAFAASVLPFALVGALSFGGDALIAALIYEITAESTPEGTWSVSLLPLSSEGIVRNRLMHSLLYDDQLAVDEIADWIKTLPAGRSQEEASNLCRQGPRAAP